MSLFSKFFSPKPTEMQRHGVPEFTLSSKVNLSTIPSSKFDSVYHARTLIANRYEIVKAFKGGMGIVYLCIDREENNNPVALKTFLPEYLPDRKIRDLFLKEGETWIRLGKHPHIVRCHQVRYWHRNLLRA